MYNIFFISYDESNADQNWSNLKSRFPTATRIHGIKGINNAHAACAEQSLTKMFWTVDGDTVVDDTFGFDYPIMPWDEKYLHVWYSRNPVNGLEYGYSAVKLWPTAVAKKKTERWLDFTTSVGKIKIVDNVISTTLFNSDAYNAWKSGFRESVKLYSNFLHNNNVESANRLLIWMNNCYPVPYATDTKRGARDAVSFVNQSQHDAELIGMINDFDWLKNKFTQLESNCYNNDDVTLEQLQLMIGYTNV